MPARSLTASIRFSYVRRCQVKPGIAWKRPAPWCFHSQGHMSMLWNAEAPLRAKSMVGQMADAPSRLRRAKDLWMQGRVGGSPTSEDDSIQGASMQAQDSSSTLSVLISDGSRQLSNLSSPFVSVLPGARNAAVDMSDAERADEDLAQQLFRAAQARQKRQSTR